MTLRRVLLDTNVCYPMSLLDLLLRADEASLHKVVWTEDLLVELAEVWVRNSARSIEAAQQVCDHIRKASTGQDVPRADYEHLIAAMPGDDPDDHPHAAAAVARAPATIVTADLVDFPAGPLATMGVTVARPDDYLLELFRHHPTVLAAIVTEMAADRHRPVMTPAEVLEALERAGVSAFTRHVRARLEGRRRQPRPGAR